MVIYLLKDPRKGLKVRRNKSATYLYIINKQTIL